MPRTENCKIASKSAGGGDLVVIAVKVPVPFWGVSSNYSELINDAGKIRS